MKVKDKIFKKANLKIIGNTLYWAVVFLLVVIAAAVTFSAFSIPGGIKLYTVQSGSMSPNIATGSLVVSRPFVDYKVGDVITFKAKKDESAKNPKYTTTHRIAEIKEVNGETLYVTKGDANNAPDLESTPQKLVLGKVILSIPLLGFPVSFSKTREGLVLLIVIPATIIIYSELMTIKNETLRLMAERKRRKLTTKEKIEEKIGEEIITVEKEIKGAEKGMMGVLKIKNRVKKV